LSSGDLLKASSILKNMNVLITYTGAMEHRNIENLCEAIEAYLNANMDKRKIVSKILSVFIELSQNIQHYLKKKEMSTFFNRIITDSTVICFGNKNDSLFLYAGNWIENVDISEIEGELQHLYNMTKEEIYDQYRSKMYSDCFGNSDSAGLGLMQLFRKSQCVNHEIIPKDDHWSFLLVNVCI